MLMTQGGQTLVNSVKPAGDSTPARPDAAGHLGFCLQGTACDTVGFYGELGLMLIQRWL